MLIDQRGPFGPMLIKSHVVILVDDGLKTVHQAFCQVVDVLGDVGCAKGSGELQSHTTGGEECWELGDSPQAWPGGEPS